MRERPPGESSLEGAGTPDYRRESVSVRKTARPGDRECLLFGWMVADRSTGDGRRGVFVVGGQHACVAAERPIGDRECLRERERETTRRWGELPFMEVNLIICARSGDMTTSRGAEDIDQIGFK